MVSEQVLVAGIQEELGVPDRLDKLAGRVEIAAGNEHLVGVQRVDLERDALRPRGAELGRRDAGVKQQRSFRARPRLASICAGITPSENPA